MPLLDRHGLHRALMGGPPPSASSDSVRILPSSLHPSFSLPTPILLPSLGPEAPSRISSPAPGSLVNSPRGSLSPSEEAEPLGTSPGSRAECSAPGYRLEVPSQRCRSAGSCGLGGVPGAGGGGAGGELGSGTTPPSNRGKHAGKPTLALHLTCC